MLNSLKLSVGDLEAAVKVSESGHFTRAGETIHRSQTSVTKGVQRVEQALGAPLLDRKARPITPTRSGEVFAYQMRKALYFMERGIAGARRASRIPEELQVGHTSYFDLDLLTRLLTMSRRPGSTFFAVFHSSSSAEVITNVLAGFWHCGFIVNPADTRGLATVPIADDPIGVVLPRAHPLAHKRSLRLENIANEPIILPSRERNPAFRSWFLQKCHAGGITPRIVQEVSNPHEGSVLASQGLGIALTPRSSAKHLPRGALVYRPFAGQIFSTQMQLVLPKERPSASLRAFVRAAVKVGGFEQDEAVPAKPSQRISSTSNTSDISAPKSAASA